MRRLRGLFWGEGEGLRATLESSRWEKESPRRVPIFLFFRLSGDAVRARAGKPDMAITWGYGLSPAIVFVLLSSPVAGPFGTGERGRDNLR